MRRHDEETPEDPRYVLPPRRPSNTRTIETVLLASTACLLAAVAWPIAMGGLDQSRDGGDRIEDVATPAPGSTPAPAPSGQPKIQLALLLDTSGSMDGLIDQARGRLWNVVNALDSASFQGATPLLEVAVYEYGNDRISGEVGHIRRVVGFTTELDDVSKGLFSLSTHGGSEHAPEAIVRATDELEWKDGDGVLRVLYVAGNESFQQGPVAWTAALDTAMAKGVVVNTVYCGDASEMDAPLWQAAAARGRGRHFLIDHNSRVVDPTTPFDAEIGELGRSINLTYLGYGSKGSDGVANQMAQDGNASGVGSMVARGLSKSSANYVNPSWDLVDAVEQGVVDLEQMNEAELPGALAGLSAEERAEVVAEKKAEREKIRKRLAELRTERESFLAKAREDGGASGDNALDGAMIEAITEQATRAGFTMGAQ